MIAKFSAHTGQHVTFSPFDVQTVVIRKTKKWRDDEGLLLGVLTTLQLKIEQKIIIEQMLNPSQPITGPPLVTPRGYDDDVWVVWCGGCWLPFCFVFYCD